MQPNPWMVEKEMRQRRSEILRMAEQEQQARQASHTQGGGFFAFLRRLLAWFAGEPEETHREAQGVHRSKNLQTSR